MTTETTTPNAATTTEGAGATQATQPTATVADAGGQQQQAQDTTTDTGKPASQPEGAPEKYDFKPGEGVTFDDAVVGAFSEVAKELNLSQANAQKVLDKVAPVMAARQAEQITAARTAWTEATRADKEFGGEKLDENLAVAKKALDTFGTPELRTLLNDSGLGDHPEVIRAFYRAGKAISEDRVVTGQAGVAANADPAKRLFPNQA